MYYLIKDKQILAKINDKESLSDYLLFFIDKYDWWVEVFKEVNFEVEDRSEEFKDEFKKWLADKRKNEANIKDILKKYNLEFLDGLIDKIREEDDKKIILDGSYLTITGDEPYLFSQLLLDEDFDVVEEDNNYPYSFTHKKDNIEISWTEGDITIVIWK